MSTTNNATCPHGHLLVMKRHDRGPGWLQGYAPACSLCPEGQPVTVPFLPGPRQVKP